MSANNPGNALKAPVLEVELKNIPGEGLILLVPFSEGMRVGGSVVLRYEVDGQPYNLGDVYIEKPDQDIVFLLEKTRLEKNKGKKFAVSYYFEDREDGTRSPWSAVMVLKIKND